MKPTAGIREYYIEMLSELAFIHAINQVLEEDKLGLERFLRSNFCGVI